MLVRFYSSWVLRKRFRLCSRYRYYFIGFLMFFCKWKTRIDGSDFYVFGCLCFPKRVRAYSHYRLLFFLAKCLYRADRPLSVTVSFFGNLLRKDLWRSGDSLGWVFSEILRGRTGVVFLENASAFALIFPGLYFIFTFGEIWISIGGGVMSALLLKPFQRLMIRNANFLP